MGQDMKAHVLVGKSGLSENILSEIARQLDDEEIIKVKVLRNSPIVDMEEISNILLEKVDCRIAEIKGRTLMLVKN